MSIWVTKAYGREGCIMAYFSRVEVINGASDLLEQLFEERGRHARTSIAVNIMPGNIPVEIEMVLQVRAEPGMVDSSPK
jgi:enamine deaminase RidA (YjgF/YER057c/UK114 family)